MGRHDDKTVGCTVGLLAIILSVPLSMWAGFALSYLWGWFIVPLGVHRIGLAHAMGISMIAHMLTSNSSSTTSDDDDSTSRTISKILTHAIAPAVALLFGWIYTHWM